MVFNQIADLERKKQGRSINKIISVAQGWV